MTEAPGSMSDHDDWIWDLVDLAAAQAASSRAGMDAAFERLAAAGRHDAVEEALLQSYLFLGFPAAIEALRRWRAVRPDTPDAAPEDWRELRERGEEVCTTIYGAAYDRLRQNIARFHPDLDRWMVEEGYGKVLGRPGLELVIREMLIVAMLVVTGPPGRRQLRSHLQGALNAGATAEQVEAVIRRAARFAKPEALELANKLWSNLRAST